MTGTMDNGGAKPMDRGNRGAKPMDAMDGGGAKPSGAMGDMSGGVKPMGAASHGDVQGNGGGPEPHQGSNPGAQSDPGPKETGFYDKAGGHMGGDDGVQNAVERPSPMRMGGVGGTQPNQGQRGGQNTGTSGSQTTSQVGWRMAGTARSQMVRRSSEEEHGTDSASRVTGAHEPGHTGTDAGSESDVHQSRAAERLATAAGGANATGSRMDEPVVDFDTTPAARAGEMAEGAVEKPQGLFAKAKDAVEDFLDADVDGDGDVGAQGARMDSETYGTGGKARATGDWDQADDGWGDSTAGTSYERDTPGTRPYNVNATTRIEAQQREKELTAA